MQKNGGRKVRITIVATIQVKEFERPGERVQPTAATSVSTTIRN